MSVSIQVGNNLLGVKTEWPPSNKGSVQTHILVELLVVPRITGFWFYRSTLALICGKLGPYSETCYCALITIFGGKQLHSRSSRAESAKRARLREEQQQPADYTTCPLWRAGMAALPQYRLDLKQTCKWHRNDWPLDLFLVLEAFFGTAFTWAKDAPVSFTRNEVVFWMFLIA